MAGVTDASFRQFVKRIAPETVVYTEFLSSDAIVYGAKKTMTMLQFDPSVERPLIVQIFGSDPQKFLEACKVIEQMGADGIDINMGCPAAKIVSSCYGSALIRNPGLASELVAAATKAVQIPVSVKTRLGWENAETLIPFCEGLVAAGAKALSIHGRSYRQKFSGEADWGPTYELKRRVSVPVIGNGDIASPEDALTKLQNLDGVMVGRGTFGNPWILRDIADALRGKRSTNAPCLDARMLYNERLPYILEHCELSVRMKGERRGVLEMRRHLSSYIKGFDGAKELRMRVMEIEDLGALKHVLQSVS